MRILKINSLPKVNENWVDRDMIMLHACFQILEDYIEKENGDTHCNYKAHKDFVDELRFLNKWWKWRKNASCYNIDDSPNIKIATDDEDDEMLSRLIKIRTSLWT